MTLMYSTMKRKLYSRIIPFGKNSIVKRKRLWGIVDPHDTALLPIVYTRIHWFQGGFAGIQMDGLWGLVDTKANITISPLYNALMYNDVHNVCVAEKGEDNIVVSTDGIELMRVSGNRIRFEGEKILIYKKGSYQLFNLDGTPFSKLHNMISSEGTG